MISWHLTTLPEEPSCYQTKDPCAQAIAAGQITIEDYFLASVHLEPLKIVGYEGLWGCIAMAGLVLPLLQHFPGEDGSGIHEDTLDSLQVSSHFPHANSIKDMATCKPALQPVGTVLKAWLLYNIMYQRTFH